MKLGKQHAIGKQLNQRFMMSSTQLTYDLDTRLTVTLYHGLRHLLVDRLDDEIYDGVFDDYKKFYKK